MIHDELPTPDDVEVKEVGDTEEARRRDRRGATCWAARGRASRSRPSASCRQGVRRHGRRLDPPRRQGEPVQGRQAGAGGPADPRRARRPSWPSTCFGTGELSAGEAARGRSEVRRLHLRLQPAAAGQPRPRHPDGGGLRPRPREDEDGPPGRLRARRARGCCWPAACAATRWRARRPT